jgi:NAD+ kinase
LNIKAVTPIKKVYIFVGSHKDADGIVRKGIEKVALENGGTVVDKPENADFIAVLGGDGTIMRASHLACKLDKAVIGINLGRVGYMAELQSDEVHSLSEVFKGNFTEEKRMMLSVTANGRKEYALNDAVIHAKSTHMSKFLLKCNGSMVSLYRGDGLILATPTGSTAYSMSAGGAVVEPRLECICVTPICPQSPLARPLVFAADNVFTAIVESDGCMLTVDGREPEMLKKGATVTIKKSEVGLRMIKLKEEGFYRVLRKKSDSVL